MAAQIAIYFSHSLKTYIRDSLVVDNSCLFNLGYNNQREHCSIIQGDQLYMTASFWYHVKSDLSSERMYIQ